LNGYVIDLQDSLIANTHFATVHCSIVPKCYGTDITSGSMSSDQQLWKKLFLKIAHFSVTAFILQDVDKCVMMNFFPV
jgi:hypothetical protein